jgi:hypothetical protein
VCVFSIIQAPPNRGQITNCTNTAVLVSFHSACTVVEKFSEFAGECEALCPRLGGAWMIEKTHHSWSPSCARDGNLAAAVVVACWHAGVVLCCVCELVINGDRAAQPRQRQLERASLGINCSKCGWLCWTF